MEQYMFFSKKLALLLISFSVVAACAGGDSAAEKAENCVSGERVTNGAEYTLGIN